jgi:hypothetical protein
MSTPVLGIVVGGLLGLLDGLSAWFQPEARPMMMPIIIGSTIKGVLTGVATGLVARWRRSMALGIAAGLAVGLVLSVIAAAGQPDHFWSIVLPGMLVGLLTGVITQRARAVTVLAICIVAAASLSAQSSAAPDPLAALDPLIGRWQGTQEGQPGKGTVEREYSRMLRSRFIRARNRSVYPPQDKNPKGEEHEDEGIFSFHSARKQILFRQFHVEGFVIQYVMEPVVKPGTIVFVSEAIDNIPAGYKARETYHLIGPDEFEEVFELAEPGKDFAVYSRSRLKRAR